MAKSRRGKRVRRSGNLPGHYHRQGVVTIHRQSLTEGDPRTWDVRDNYIVETDLLDRGWRFRVEFKGEAWAIPGAVFERMQTQRESIIREQRLVKAQERFQAQAEAILGEKRPTGL